MRHYISLSERAFLNVGWMSIWCFLVYLPVSYQNNYPWSGIRYSNILYKLLLNGRAWNKRCGRSDEHAVSNIAGMSKWVQKKSELSFIYVPVDFKWLEQHSILLWWRWYRNVCWCSSDFKTPIYSCGYPNIVWSARLFKYFKGLLNTSNTFDWKWIQKWVRIHY